MRVLVTGANGLCGTALTGLKADTLFLDRNEPLEIFSGEEFIRVDLCDMQGLHKAMHGCNAVVHLGAASAVDTEWPVVMRDNIEGTRALLAVAVESGIERIVFASSNHVVGMYERENIPWIYEPGHGILVDHRSPVRPDSPYGVSKVFGENIGRFYAENGGPRFYALRIGSVRGAWEDHPYAYAEEGVRKGRWTRGSEEYVLQEKRLKAIWQSRRDFLQMVELCLEYHGPNYDLFYGVSDNARSWMDIRHARRKLGYAPLDKAEDWRGPSATSIEEFRALPSRRNR